MPVFPGSLNLLLSVPGIFYQAMIVIFFDNQHKTSISPCFSTEHTICFPPVCLYPHLCLFCYCLPPFDSAKCRGPVRSPCFPPALFLPACQNISLLSCSDKAPARVNRPQRGRRYILLFPRHLL